MTLDDQELDQLLEASGALKQGHFQLSSGFHSPAYVQCALLLEDPLRARRIGQALAARLAETEPDSVLAPALGGLIIGHEVAAALGVPFRFAERSSGSMSLRRGFELDAGERIVLVEDVVTTGGSLHETTALAAERGAEIVAIGAILNRTGKEGIFHVPFMALRKLELPIWSPEQCPLCLEGGSVERPGSRSLS